MSEIVLIGNTSAGKTTYLTVLPRAMNLKEWVLRYDEDTLRILRAWQAKLTSNRFPAATDASVDFELQFYLSKLRRDGRGHLTETPEVSVRVPDVAGVKGDSASSYGGSFYDKYVKSANGLLILIDSTSTEESHGEYLLFFEAVRNSLLTLIRERQAAREEWFLNGGDKPQTQMPGFRYLPGGACIYLAVCLTKCDSHASVMIDPQSGLTALGSTDAALENAIGELAHKCLMDLCRNSAIEKKLFACSAVGFQRSGGNYLRDKKNRCISQIGKKEGVDDTLVQGASVLPEGVDKPLIWLLDRIYDSSPAKVPFGLKLKRLLNAVIEGE